MGYSFQKLGEGSYRISGVRISPTTGKYITEKTKKEAVVTKTEYQLKVTVKYDTKGGMKAGDSYYPFSEPSTDKDKLVRAAIMWDAMGHVAEIESRTTNTTYSDWKVEQ